MSEYKVGQQLICKHFVSQDWTKGNVSYPVYEMSAIEPVTYNIQNHPCVITHITDRKSYNTYLIYFTKIDITDSVTELRLRSNFIPIYPNYNKLWEEVNG